MGRARSARGLAYLAAAVAVHALLLLPARDRPRVEAPSQTDLTVVETDVATEAPEDVPAPAPPHSEIASAVRSPSSPARVAAGREHADREEGEPRGPEPSVEAPGADGQTGAPDEKSGGWSLQPEPPMDLTSPGVIARATRSLEGEVPQAGVSATGGVAEGLDAHDAAIGMGRGGPVLAALESAASGGDAPFEGAATFDVAIQTDGHVSVALLDGAGAVGEWTKVGEATRAALDPRRVRIPPGARGWHVVVRLEAKVQYPNGLDPKKLGPKVTTSSSRPGVLGPSVSLAEMGKVCSVALTLGLTLNPISGGCDPSNIGTRTLRVVHGHITSEGRL